MYCFTTTRMLLGCSDVEEPEHIMRRALLKQITLATAQTGLRSVGNDVRPQSQRGPYRCTRGSRGGGGLSPALFYDSSSRAFGGECALRAWAARFRACWTGEIEGKGERGRESRPLVRSLASSFRRLCRHCQTQISRPPVCVDVRYVGWLGQVPAPRAPLAPSPTLPSSLMCLSICPCSL